ncbi:MAG TPA: beta/gamma crystallin-related protein, partial [Burkholderiales bacterium]|nr:beta/gamma crystallin-related protein [Burkholderiales bacterium]
MKSALAATALIISAQAAADVTFYEREDFRGRTFTTGKPVNNLERAGFNDRASSAVVRGRPWEFCDSARFDGRCVVLSPGRYPSLTAMGLNDRVSSVREGNVSAPAPVAAANVPAQITLYERENFRGKPFSTVKRVGNLDSVGFNDRASSAVVLGDRWEVCDDARFAGSCKILRPGRYPSLAAMGLNDRISSVRDVTRNARVEDARYAPEPVAAYDNRRRGSERMYEASVTSSRVVVATPEKRCWVEQGHAQEKGGYNVPGAVIGAIVGGVLGHQVGGGTGNTIATVGGVAAGGAIGANVGRTNQPATQDVQRCENVPSQTQ